MSESTQFHNKTVKVLYFNNGSDRCNENCYLWLYLHKHDNVDDNGNHINISFSCNVSFTGHISETRRLVVAISLSGSAVSFSFTGAQSTGERKDYSVNN